MNWINPPETIRRFSLNQIAQHGAASLLFLVLGISAALSGYFGGTWTAVHVGTGIGAAAFVVVHLISLVGTGVRHDVEPDHIAFLPAGWEWRRIRRGPGGTGPTGKYSPEEKGDYLALLLLGLLAAGTGCALYWPSRLHVPGEAAYGWLRAFHAGSGAALTLHVLLVHVPGRWLDAAPSFRWAILTGRVPLSQAVLRPGWVSDLTARGVLVPVPEEARTEVDRETRQVRNLLDDGNRLVGEGRFAEAASVFEEALALFPDYSQARFNLGVARMKEGRRDLAAEQFRLFIEADPFNPVAAKAKELLGSLDEGKGGAGA